MTERNSHTSSRGATPTRTFALVLTLTVVFTVVELVGGLLAGSLALLADAGHMLSDAFSLALALFASWLAARPATPQKTFGYKRAEILAALANGVTLVAIAIWIFVEAYHRFRDPPDVLGGWVLAIASAGVAVNLAGGFLLGRSRGGNLNAEAAFRHVLADLGASLGVVAAGLVILTTGWAYADPLVSVVIGVLILASSWAVLRESLRILLEATPAGIDASEVAARIRRQPGVVDVHDLHIWTITSGFPALSAHVLVREHADCHTHRRDIEELLAKEFGIEHTTLQVDHEAPRNVRWVDRLPGWRVTQV